MRVAKHSQATAEVGIADGVQVVLAGAMSSSSKIRVQGKTEGDKILVVAFNDMDSEWNGAVSWLAI